MSTTQRITTSLQETVRHNHKIGNVYFDAKGNHYFMAYRLSGSKEKVDDKSSHELYGRGKYAGSRLIPGPNVDKLKEALSIGHEDTKITEIVSREDILSAQAIPDDNSAMAAMLADPNAKAHLMQQLLSNPEFVGALKEAIGPAPTPVAEEKSAKKNWKAE